MKKINLVTKLSCLLAGVALFVFTDAALALKATEIAGNVTDTMAGAAKIMQSVALVAGIGFIMAAFFKFHQHKQNPTQVPLSQGLAMLVIGAGLVLFPTLIPTATSIITGTTSGTAKVSGSSISSLIGSK